MTALHLVPHGLSARARCRSLYAESARATNGWTWASRLLELMGSVVPGAQERANRRFLVALPDAVEQVARSMRSGASVIQAIVETAPTLDGPVKVAFERVGAGVSQGQPLTDALNRMARENPLGEVRLVVAALALAADSGAGPVRALDGVGQSLRDRDRLRGEVAALTAQARASASMLIGLPLVFVAVNAIFDSSSLMFLLTDPVGRLCLVVGLGLDVVGWVAMRRLVAKVAT